MYTNWPEFGLTERCLCSRELNYHEVIPKPWPLKVSTLQDMDSDATTPGSPVSRS
ncbi:unnamed protein product [Fusarium graminearum]|uniref:Chromosome 2, complete genome n=1 Tax=Gibberella zeae (strain ATCC MYA-4620 / CBS 123657 / FGSC 9075 / NRRL 31084 / PH-1) TaxID=229533 RepID=A0A0E0S6T0_GIBZE|nr:hypothetical protein FG05_35364 [Fusarium graminearum]CEF79205.1 unnamed protein product [Fusarium graminearum]CZS82487.1 unnamed protein product [Fusarium graminearum]